MLFHLILTIKREKTSYKHTDQQLLEVIMIYILGNKIVVFK